MSVHKGRFRLGFAILLLSLCCCKQPQVTGQKISRLWWNDLKPFNSTSLNQTALSSPKPSPSPLPVQSAPISLPETASLISPNEDDLYDLEPDTVDTSSVSDDELLSEASKLNSKMIRLGRKTEAAVEPQVRQAKSSSKSGKLSSPSASAFPPHGEFLRRETQFDDSPDSEEIFTPTRSASASTQKFMKRAGNNFFDNDQNSVNNRGGSGDPNSRIWSYFENKMNAANSANMGRDNEPGSGFSSRFNENSRPSSTSDFISQHFNKRGSPIASMNRLTSTRKPTTPEADRLVPFNFGPNRKKDPEEKKRWSQLIQSIFDSTPREGGHAHYPGARVATGKSKFIDSPFSYGPGVSAPKSKATSRVLGSNALGSGKTGKAPIEDEEDEDVLKGEVEENVDLKDKIDDAEEGKEAEAGPEDESEENEAGDSAEEKSVNKKRQVAPITQEDDDEEPEEDGDVDPEDEENQYLNGAQNGTQMALIGNGSAKRSPTTESSAGKSFGARIHRSNGTSGAGSSFTSPGRRLQGEKPKFKFQLGKSVTPVPETAITALKNDPSFDGTSTTGFNSGIIGGSTPSFAAATTTTTPSSPLDVSTERFDVLEASAEEPENDDEDLFEMSKPVNRDFSTASPPVTTTERPPKKRASSGSKRTKTGKWRDNQTFRVNDDRSMIMLPEDEEDEDPDNFRDDHVPSLNEVPHGPSRGGTGSRRNRMAGTGGTVAPPTITKRRLNTASQRRTVRQDDGAQGDAQSGDELSRLAAALPGTPGQDYPIFGLIPRTGFNCKDHKWPGYYADAEAGCQVFHICQSGGRLNSFLCPNGTLFNQQLFICDWWHNVQCDAVQSHYELNANIYDYNWESKRMAKSSKRSVKTRSSKASNTLLTKRAGDLPAKETLPLLVDDELPELSGIAPTTTASPLDEIETGFTTTESPTVFTEVVFGTRGPKSEGEGEAKRKRQTPGGAVKGGKLIKFNRLSGVAPGFSGKSKSAALMTASFLNRYKYAMGESSAKTGSKLGSGSSFHSVFLSPPPAPAGPETSFLTPLVTPPAITSFSGPSDLSSPSLSGPSLPSPSDLSSPSLLSGPSSLPAPAAPAALSPVPAPVPSPPADVTPQASSPLPFTSHLASLSSSSSLALRSRHYRA